MSCPTTQEAQEAAREFERWASEVTAEKVCEPDLSSIIGAYQA